MHMFENGGWFMGWMHFAWWIFWVVLAGVLAWAIWGRPRDTGSGASPPMRETPLETLQRRLANGECTPEEYEKRKAILERDRPAGR